MKIGLSSAVFYPQKSEIAIDKLCKMGFRVSEFFYNCEYEISEEFLSQIKSVCETSGTEIISVHPFTAFAESVYFFSEYERRCEEQLAKYAEIFKRVKWLGAKYFTLHGDRAHKGLGDDVCKLTCGGIQSLQKLSDAARQAGITLCLENVAWCKSANINYLKSVSENVDGIGFTLDLKQARRAGVPWESYLDVMGDKLRNIHISDFDENNDCLLPGEGLFDFRQFFSRIEEVGYKGDVIVEVYSSNYSDEKRISASKSFLEDIAGI